jgi:hypothetical protein
VDVINDSKMEQKATDLGVVVVDNVPFEVRTKPIVALEEVP